MSEVVSIEERRKAKGKIHYHGIEGMSYECLRCNGQSFTLWANGKITCLKCTALMKNLRVVWDKDPA